MVESFCHATSGNFVKIGFIYIYFGIILDGDIIFVDYVDILIYFVDILTLIGL